MWSKVERQVSEQPYYTLASLRAQIWEVMAVIDRKVVIHACKKFWSWIEAIVEASGGFIEQMCR